MSDGAVREIRSDLSEQELEVTVYDLDHFDLDDEETAQEVGRMYTELTAEYPHIHGDY
jgi:hypothetical protein